MHDHYHSHPASIWVGRFGAHLIEQEPSLRPTLAIQRAIATWPYACHLEPEEAADILTARIHDHAACECARLHTRAPCAAHGQRAASPEGNATRPIDSPWRTRMTSRTYPPFNATARLVAAAALAATFAMVPVLAGAADKDAHEDRVELRVTSMHTKLKITAAQEAQWKQVAQAMRDDAKRMDELTQARVDHAKDMTAVDDLKSYGEISQAHADGIKKLTPAFADLYASMTDAQKKEADTLFRHSGSGASHHKM